MDDAVGICGLGNLGGAIAARLGATLPVVGYDRDPVKMQAYHDVGGQTVTSLEELASCAVVILSLPGPQASHEVVDALADHLPPGSVLMETSTVAPEDIHRMSDRCSVRSVGVVDAAVLGGVAAMRAGEARLLVGGRSEERQVVAPVLDAITSDWLVLGEAGAGMAAKVINNAVAHGLYVVLAEAAALARASGVELGTLLDILGHPSAGLTRPLEHRLGERYANRDFDGGMQTEMAYKDSLLALQMAQRLGVPLFVTQAAHTVYEIARQEGLGSQDYAAVATLWEKWLGD